MQAQLEAAARLRAQLAAGQARGLQEGDELAEASATLERIMQEQQVAGVAGREGARGQQDQHLLNQPTSLRLTLPNPRRRPAKNKETTAGGKKRIRAKIVSGPTLDSLITQSMNSNVSTHVSNLTAVPPPPAPTLSHATGLTTEIPFSTSDLIAPSTPSAFSFSDFMFFELFFDLLIAPSIERSQIPLPSLNLPLTNQVLFDPLAAAFPANPPATLAHMRIALFKYQLMQQFLSR